MIRTLKEHLLPTVSETKILIWPHVVLFTVRFHPTRPSCKDLRQVAKFCDRLNPKFQTYATESTTNIIQLIALLWLCCFLWILFDLLIQFIAGRSCIRNNIVNVPTPTLAEYKYFSLSRQHIESTKIHLVESVIIQKKMSRSNGKI